MRKRASGRVQSALLFCFFLSGFLRAFSHDASFIESNIPQGKGVFSGLVVTIPDKYDEYQSFVLDKVKIEGLPVPCKVRLSAPVSLPLSSGDYISGFASFKTPVILRNPGVSFLDLKSQGIGAVGHVYELYAKAKAQGWRCSIERKRQFLKKTIEHSLSHDKAAVAAALILGTRGQISPELKDQFSASGVAHLLSISGAHFGLLSLIVFWIFKKCINRLPGKLLLRLSLTVTASEIAALLTISVLVLYLFLSSFKIPTIRAFIMISTYCAALVLQRKGQLINCLSLAALLILLWHPDSLFDISFQLSFLAVLSIGLYLKKTESAVPEEIEPSFIHKFIEKNTFSLMITLSAILGTAPIVITVFNNFSLIAPLSNLLIAPLVCFVILPLTFFSSLLVLIFDLSILPLAPVIEILVSLALMLINWFSSLPISNTYLPDPSFFIIAAYFISLGLVYTYRRIWTLFILVCVIFLYLASNIFISHNARVTFLDAGQADSAVIKLPDKRIMVIDGGTLRTGSRALVPFLKSQGIEHIDFLVLSHLHPDHFQGFTLVLDYFTVSEFWYNGRINEESQEFFHRIKSKNIPMKKLIRGNAFVSDKYRIIVLHPYDTFYADSERRTFSNENSDSLVLKILIHDTSLLFTGDIEEEAEWDISHLGQWLKSDIIKVPHHGGRTSSSSFFIDLVNPDAAVISAGHNSQFGHPHKETLERYSGCQIMRTDRDGAVVIDMQDRGYSVRTFKDFQLKKVRAWSDEIRNLFILAGVEK